ALIFIFQQQINGNQSFPLTFSSVSRQYHLITDKKSWTDAQTYCRNNYKDLATAENDLDFGRIQREAQRLGFTSEAWVGLFNDINSWRCSRDEVPLGSWTNWGADQPNNANAVDESFDWNLYGWFDDEDCSDQRAFFCQSCEFNLVD
uniref:C-type lectin domain-containing protein n=1 Tax=Astyanax mexicanus TaxID=7994 RepID=A0A8B9LMN1_ASTMX